MLGVRWIQPAGVVPAALLRVVGTIVGPLLTVDAGLGRLMSGGPGYVIHRLFPSCVRSVSLRDGVPWLRPDVPPITRLEIRQRGTRKPPPELARPRTEALIKGRSMDQRSKDRWGSVEGSDRRTEDQAREVCLIRLVSSVTWL